MTDLNFLVGPLSFAVAGLGAWLILMWFERRADREEAKSKLSRN